MLVSTTISHNTQDALAPFVAEACLAVMPPLPAKAMLSVENVRVCKLLGGSAADSHVVRGMVVQRDAQVRTLASVMKAQHERDVAKV